MEIKRLAEQDYDDFLAFHAKVYPTHSNVKERFNFQFLENPLLQDKTKTQIFLARDKENNIIGQYGVNPQEYSFAGITYLGFCGCDLFVDEQARKYGAGGLLSMKAIYSSKPHFSIGVSTEAKPILSSLQMRKIGKVRRYLWLRNWSKTPELVLQTVWQRKWKSLPLTSQELILPSIISAGNFSFSLLTSAEQIALGKQNATSDLIPDERMKSDEPFFQFVRSRAFLHWRFFSRPGYYVYQNRRKINSTTEDHHFAADYFALRIVQWKNLQLLALVDLQSDSLNSAMMQAMVMATKKMAKENKCDGIITLSSNARLDKVLKSSFFVNMASPFEIYTNVDIYFSPKKIQKREATYITMVDSDLEFSFWPKV